MLISLLVLAIIPWAYAEFFYPPMKGRGVLRTGERQTIKYKTPYTEYTIALWQQALSGGAATLGPIIYQTTNGPNSRFDWLVQTYDFELAESNVFFFWLFQGGPDMQGNQTVGGMPSSFFNMTDVEAPSSSSSTTSELPTPTPTSVATSTLVSAPTTTTPSTAGGKDGQASSGGMSTGATIGLGLGVGLGVVGLCSIAGVIFWAKRKSRKAKQAEQQFHQVSYRGPTPKDQWPIQYPQPPPPPPQPPRYPVEMNARNSTVAELG